MRVRAHQTIILADRVHLEGELLDAEADAERLKRIVAEGRGSWTPEPTVDVVDSTAGESDPDPLPEPEPTAEAVPAPPSIRPKPRKKAVQ